MVWVNVARKRRWIKFPPVSRKRLLPTTASFIKRRAESILTVCAGALILDCYLVKRTSLVKRTKRFKEREIMRIREAEEHSQREIVFMSLEMGIDWGFVVSPQFSSRNRSYDRRAPPCDSKSDYFRLVWWNACCFCYGFVEWMLMHLANKLWCGIKITINFTYRAGVRIHKLGQMLKINARAISQNP